ncbi:hypothetical protein KA977_08290 [Candidatus Dependentiae bacterium]|nr:hypothetical protein [Candidatus Dependentiae bacterium]
MKFIIRTKYLYLLLFLLFIPSILFAAPWWWAQFTIGDGTNSVNSGFERWLAFISGLGNSTTDTTYVCSYTWGTGGIGTINGINTTNSMGLNSHSAAGGVPDYLIADGDGGTGLTNATGLTDANITDVTESAGGVIMHIKDIFVANKGYLVSSANHTSGGFDSQHNNAIFFPWWGMSTGMRAKAEEQMREMAAGTFHDATQYSGGDIFYSPYGDTIELRYSPEDNDDGYAAGSGSLLSRYRQLVALCKESIFFMSDAWSSSAGTDALRDDIIAKSGIIWRGCSGSPATSSDWDATTISNFQGDANGTLRNQPGGFNQLHSKIFIFDMEIVATGSANMTAAAMYDSSSNDEVNIIVHDFRLARRYMNHYHHIMTNSGVTNDPSSDGYDNTAPNAPSNFSITPGASTFSAAWTPSTSTDISRYYIFVDTLPITKNRIGDRVDDDADGYYDEDPIGNADGFSSGSADNLSDISANDDDADGSADEDPWMYPEVMVKTTSGASCIISSWNVGESLLENVNYYFAIVAVDTQGNESAVDTSGPHTLVTLTNVEVETFYNVVSDTFYTNESNITVMSVNITGTSGDILDTFTLNNSGNMDSNQINSVKLWYDTGVISGIWDSSDGFAGQLTWQSSKQWYSNSLNIPLSASSSSFIVTISANQYSVTNDSFQAKIPVNGIDSRNLLPAPSSILTNPFFQYCSNTISISKTSEANTYVVYKNLDNIELLKFTIYPNPYNDSLTFISVSNNGGANNTDFSNIKLYSDSNSNGFDTSDLFMGELFWSGTSWDSNSLNFGLLSGPNYILITGKASSSISTGDTAQFKLNTLKTAFGDTVNPSITNLNISTCSNAVYLSQYNLTNAGYFKNTSNIPVFIGTILGIQSGDSLTTISIKNTSSTLDSTKISSMKLWFDNGDSSLNTGIDTFIDTFAYTGSNIYSCTNLNRTISNSSFIISIDINGNAAPNDTFNLIFEPLSCKTLFGDSFPASQISASRTVSITGAIECSISSPENNIDTISSVIRITGTTLSTNSGDTIKIYLNGVLITDSSIFSSNANFDTLIQLTDSVNTITVAAVSHLSDTNVDTKYIIVNYYSVPSVYITYPVISGIQYDTTASGYISISGTIANARNGDTLSIYVNGVLNDKLIISSGSWSGTAAIYLYSETVTVTITDRFNQTDTKYIIVTPGIIISGSIELDGAPTDSGTLVSISNDSFIFTAVTNETGEFTLRVLSQDTFVINFKKLNYTSYDTQIFISENINLGTVVILNAGDFYFDGKINIKDAALIKKYFGQSGTVYDINGDNKISGEEKTHLKKNYSK